MVYDAHGADTDLVIDKGRGHALKDNTVYDAMQFMYQRLTGSGVTKDKPLTKENPNWKSMGKLMKFDQDQIIKDISADYIKVLGKQVNLD